MVETKPAWPPNRPTSVPPSSTLTTLIAANPPKLPHQTYHQSLALQVLHNLRHQHYWTSLHLHTHSPIYHQPLPRPILSGLPPTRIYIHPDDQAEELKNGLKEEDVGVEREWVLPTRLREKWSLRRFAEVFNAVGEEPCGGVEVGYDDVQQEKKLRTGARRGGKRLLLATVGDDSTAVYYIVHDGIVKPRQN